MNRRKSIIKKKNVHGVISKPPASNYFFLNVSLIKRDKQNCLKLTPLVELMVLLGCWKS